MNDCCCGVAGILLTGGAMEDGVDVKLGLNSVELVFKDGALGVKEEVLCMLKLDENCAGAVAGADIPPLGLNAGALIAEGGGLFCCC